jgi:hypothetical protein
MATWRATPRICWRMKPGLADGILVVVKNGGKFLCRRRLGRLLGDRDVIGEFGLATEAAVRRVFLSLRLCRSEADGGLSGASSRPSVGSR